MKKLYLQCSACGSRFDLPTDGTVSESGMLAIPLHASNGDLIESESDGRKCGASHQLHSIQREGSDLCFTQISGDTGDPWVYGGAFLETSDPDRPQVWYWHGTESDNPCGDSDYDDNPDTRVSVYRFDIDRCTFINGILSDNKFHPDHSAWFADSVRAIEDSYDMLHGELSEMLCTDRALGRANAYLMIGHYHGFDNLDSYPEPFTKADLQRIGIPLR